MKNISRPFYPLSRRIIKFPRGFSLHTSKLERSALLNVIREMSLSILDGHRHTDVQQTTFDRVRTINAPSPSTL